MSTIVSDILEQSSLVTSLTLGAGYQNLRNIFSPERNDLRAAKLGYAVRPLSANTVDGVLRCYTMDQVFEIVLTDTWARGDDAEKIASLAVMYNKADEIFKAMVQTKLNLSAVVLNVFNPSLTEPEFFENEKIVVLRMQYTVKWRSSLN